MGAQTIAVPAPPGLALAEHPAASRRREVTTLALLGTGSVLATAGALALSIDAALAIGLGAWTGAVGLVVAAVAVRVGRSAGPLAHVHVKVPGLGAPGGLPWWTAVKVSSVLLHQASIFAAIPLVGVVLARAGAGLSEMPPDTLARFVSVLAALVVVNAGTVHLLALAAPLVPAPRPRGALLGDLCLAAAALAALLGAAVAWPGLPGVARQDATLLLLASAVLGGAGLILARGLPTPLGILLDESAFYRGRVYASKTKAVVSPVVTAMALLGAEGLVLIAVASGFFGVAGPALANTPLMAVVVVLLIGTITAAGFAGVLHRRPDEVTLYARRMPFERRKGAIILYGSLSVATILVALAGLLYLGVDVAGLSRGRWIDLLCIGLLVGLGPYGFYIGAQYQRTRDLEERFPDFLRDLAASRKAGLTLTHAVQIAARGEYGALTPEVQKMADQLSWNVSFQEALLQLGERVRTPLVQRAVSLIMEAQHSGGQVTDVIAAAARDAREIKHLEEEREQTMVLYTSIIYLSFLVFLGVVAVLYGTFAPEIVRASSAIAAGGATQFGGLRFAQISLEQYRTFYFVSSIAQAVGNGLLAGIFGSGKPLAGLRHAFLLVAATWVTFSFVVG